MSNFGVVNVCYDLLIPISKQKDIALLASVDSDTKSLESNSEVDQDWKSCRKNIANSVDQLIDKLKGNATENGDNSPEKGINVRTTLPDSSEGSDGREFTSISIGYDGVLVATARASQNSNNIYNPFFESLLKASYKSPTSTLTIGLLLPLTGSQSDVGNAFLNGFIEGEKSSNTKI